MGEAVVPLENCMWCCLTPFLRLALALPNCKFEAVGPFRPAFWRQQRRQLKKKHQAVLHLNNPLSEAISFWDHPIFQAETVDMNCRIKHTPLLGVCSQPKKKPKLKKKSRV
jgi:hypothetical protein